jgi:polysaccharide deacetylase 2 family uncharacterized protein YibQ
MLFKKPALQPPASAPGQTPAASAPAAGVGGGSGVALASAALFFIAAAAGLLAARGNPYDGAPVVRVRITGAHSKPDKGGAPKPAVAAAPAASALPPAPIAGLTAPGPGGLLPIIAADGRASWKAYARPFIDDGRPKIALVIGGLGLDPQAAEAAIAQLPPEVTLSFSPYAEGLQGLIDKARAAGHEVMVEVPMEPLDYPDTDPGPYTLVSSASPEEIGHRLDWLMSRATGYFAVINTQGARFLGQTRAVTLFTQALRQRGVAFIDDGQAASRGDGLHRASASLRIDADLDGAAIDNQLLLLEAQSLQTGGAIGLGSAYPLTLTQVQRWAAAVRDRGYALAPASAIMTLRP